MEDWTIKTPNPIWRLFFKTDRLTEFAALCLTDFIDWRYIHSLVGIFDPACELLLPWTKELCVLLPLYLLSDLPPFPPLPNVHVQYIQTVCVRGGGGELRCRPYSAAILHSVSDQIHNLPNCITTPNKITSEDDIKGLVSLKFLLPWYTIISPFQTRKCSTSGMEPERSGCTTSRHCVTSCTMVLFTSSLSGEPPRHCRVNSMHSETTCNYD